MWICMGRVIYGVGNTQDAAYIDFSQTAHEEGYDYRPKDKCIFIQAAPDTDISVYTQLMFKDRN